MQGHTQTQHAGSTEAAPQQAPTDCDHHGDIGQKHGGRMNCSMSCCQQNGSSFMTAMIFVLPKPATISEPAQALATIANFAPASFAPEFEPISPPPRTLLSSL
jgi:hypothetical protein